jgi:hypothetical protein
MTTFKVQVYQDKLPDWETVASFKPNYRLGTMRLGRRFWFKKLVGVASNFEPAEYEALAQAMTLAKKLKRAQVRVMRESTWTGTEVKDLLWQDGKTLLKLKAIFKRKK